MTVYRKMKDVCFFILGSIIYFIESAKLLSMTFIYSIQITKETTIL